MCWGATHEKVSAVSRAEGRLDWPLVGRIMCRDTTARRREKAMHTHLPRSDGGDDASAIAVMGV